MADGALRLLEELKQHTRRCESVLVLRGTGFNIWQYFPFLRHFSLAELSEFRAVYTVSGASLLVWLYCLIEQGAIRDSVAMDYDRAMRSGLNRHGWIRRSARLLLGRYPYAARDFLNVFERLVPPAACRQTLEELPLQTWRIVAHDESRKELLVLGPEEAPSFSVCEVISRAVTWTELFGRPFCCRTPYHGLLIGDFDFADKGVRKQFREYLRLRHPDARIYQLNLFKATGDERERFARMTYDRFPRLWQLVDAAAFYFGVPNGRYRRAAERTWPA